MSAKSVKQDRLAASEAKSGTVTESAPVEEPKKKPKSHIGNMFDLLTFSDV